MTAIIVPFPTTQAGMLRYRMSDDSMREVGLSRGMVVSFVRSRAYSDGDIVLVRTPDGIFVKQVFREGNYLRLEGAHLCCRTRRYRARNCEILGLLVDRHLRDARLGRALLISVR